MDSAEKFAQLVADKDPEHADANYLLGILAARKEKFELAETFLNKAILSNPGDARYRFSQGLALWSQGKSKLAIESYGKALILDPDHEEARWAFTMAQIPIIYSTDDDPAECRASFSRELSNLIKWYEDKSNEEMGFRFVGDHQPFFLSYREEDNRSLYSQYGALCVRLASYWFLERGINPSRIAPEKADKIRIGIVSSQIRNSSVWHAIVKGWITSIDRNQFDIDVFHIGSRHDDISLWVKSQVRFYDQGEKEISYWIDTIIAQQPDVLIYPDIGLDPMTTKLASLRLAKNQVVSWGVPETTGLPTIDYYLSAEDFEPHDAQDNYTEQLVQLPHLGCTYTRLQVEPHVPDLRGLGIDLQNPVFLCPGAPFKYAPEHDQVLTDIACKVGKCQFVFFINQDRPVFSGMLRERLELAFTGSGMDPHEYIVFIPWQPSNSFFGLMKQATVYLDTIGFSGFNTAMQAVECGIPIVTKQGKYMRGRLASGILLRMGMPELITHSEEDYVVLAARLAQNEVYRKDIQAQMEIQCSVLFDDSVPAEAFQKILHDIAKGSINC